MPSPQPTLPTLPLASRGGSRWLIRLVILLAVAALAACAKHPATQNETNRAVVPAGARHQAATASETNPAAPVARATPSSAGRIFYLDRRGSDASSGRSPRTAWKSLARVSSAALRPGDTVLLRHGQVFRGLLRAAESGRDGSRIRFSGYGQGPKPQITGGCVKVTGSHIDVEGLDVTDCAWAGITVAGDDNLVSRNRIRRNVTGVYVQRGASGTQIVRNRIVNNRRMSVNTIGGDDDSGAFGVLVHGERTSIGRNVISGHHAPSFDYGTDGAAVEIYGAVGTAVHGNTARRNHAFTELGNSRTRNTTYSRNLVTSGLPNATFLVTRGPLSGYGPVRGTIAEHNTVHLTGEGSEGFVCHDGCAPDILTLYRNEIVAVAKVGYADGRTAGGHNLYWGGQIQFPMNKGDRVARP